jgi:hypothetical protein
MHSHLINNPVFAAVKADGVTPLPEGIWDLTHQVRLAVLKTIEDFGPENANYVFTNVITEEESSISQAQYQDMLDAFSRCGMIYIPVRLECSEDELIQRRDTPDRKANLKDINPANARREAREHKIIKTGQRYELTLDVTSLAPEQAAAKILAHIDAALARKAA